VEAVATTLFPTGMPLAMTIPGSHPNNYNRGLPMSTMTHDIQECIRICNSLLRGEISAIETYSDAIHKHGSEPPVSVLKQLREDHIESANLLRDNVKSMGGEPDRDSGAWGTFAKSVEKAATLFGENSTLQALQEGEEHGRNEYHEALESTHVLPECKDLIRTSLLPAIERHLSTLKSLKSENK
jgi:uncharacterized protein (TIGR02284 family)